jgi:hypothetical protein
MSTLRSEGVRRENVTHNTSKPFYAFNAFQRSCLPEVLCPPGYTCSGTIDS